MVARTSVPTKGTRNETETGAGRIRRYGYQTRPRKRCIVEAPHASSTLLETLSRRSFVRTRSVAVTTTMTGTVHVCSHVRRGKRHTSVDTARVVPGRRHGRRDRHTDSHYAFPKGSHVSRTHSRLLILRCRCRGGVLTTEALPKDRYPRYTNWAVERRSGSATQNESAFQLVYILFSNVRYFFTQSCV